MKLFQTLYTMLDMYTHTARFKEIGTLVKQSTDQCKCFLSSEHVFLA